MCLRKINEQKGGQRVPDTKPVRSVIVPAVFVLLACCVLVPFSCFLVVELGCRGGPCNLYPLLSCVLVVSGFRGGPCNVFTLTCVMSTLSSLFCHLLFPCARAHV